MKSSAIVSVRMVFGSKSKKKCPKRKERMGDWFWNTSSVVPFCRSAPAVWKKILCHKDPEFYTPLELNCRKGRTLQHWSCIKISLPKWEERKKTMTLAKIPSQRTSDFLFPLQPPVPPWPCHPRGLDFGPFRLRLALFGSVLAPFRLCFGSVSGPFRGVGWGWGEGLL